MKTTEPSKQFSITFEERINYLYAGVEAQTYNYEIVSGYCQEIAAECKLSGHTKVLIEEDIAESISMVEAYEISTQVPQKFFAGIQIAFVDTFAEQNELNKFGEIVAVNTGVNGRMFSNVAAAELWLTGT